MEEIEYLSIAPIRSNAFQLVSYFGTRVNQETKEPFQMIFQVALDQEKAGTDTVDFPVYLPAVGNYKTYAHHQMYEKFTSGEPFVAVRLHNFKVYRQKHENNNFIWGVADSFEIVEHPASFIDEEDIL